MKRARVTITIVEETLASGQTGEVLSSINAKTTTSARMEWGEALEMFRDFETQIETDRKGNQ